MSLTEMPLARAYRTIGTPHESGAFGCGFMAKPTDEHAARNVAAVDYNAVYILQGTGVYLDADARTYPLVPGSLVQRLPGRRHSTLQTPDGQWRECFLVLPAYIYAAWVAIGLLDPQRPVLAPGLHASLVYAFHQILTALQRNEADEMRVLADAHHLLAALYAADRDGTEKHRYRAVVAEACARLQQPGARVHLPNLARDLGLGYELFRKVFQQDMGISPGAYQIRQRMNQACHLLTDPQVSIRTVSEQLGYPDVYTFSKQFKLLVGMAPREFQHGKR